MPIPALPQPLAGGTSTSSVSLPRYLDDRQRPLRGEAIVIRDGQRVRTVLVHNGAVDLGHLAPGTYEVHASLRTAEGDKVRRTDSLVIG